MAREILFKAQRADTKEWVYGYPVFDFADCSLKRSAKCACEHNGELLCFYGWIDELHEYDEIEVISETICQYTNYTDLRKKKAFEHDIIFYEDGNCHGHIAFKEGHFLIEWEDGRPDLRSDIHFWLTERRVHVVGNMFDTPELLNQ